MVIVDPPKTSILRQLVWMVCTTSHRMNHPVMKCVLCEIVFFWFRLACWSAFEFTFYNFSQNFQWQQERLNDRYSTLHMVFIFILKYRWTKKPPPRHHRLPKKNAIGFMICLFYIFVQSKIVFICFLTKKNIWIIDTPRFLYKLILPYEHGLVWT